MQMSLFLCGIDLFEHSCSKCALAQRFVLVFEHGIRKTMTYTYNPSSLAIVPFPGHKLFVHNSPKSISGQLQAVFHCHLRLLKVAFAFAKWFSFPTQQSLAEHLSFEASSKSQLEKHPPAIKPTGDVPLNERVCSGETLSRVN